MGPYRAWFKRYGFTTFHHFIIHTILIFWVRLHVALSRVALLMLAATMPLCGGARQGGVQGACGRNKTHCEVFVRRR